MTFNKLLILALLICLSTLSIAQGFSFGTKGSLRNTWLFNKHNKEFKYTPTLGTNMGLFATWYITDTRGSLKRVMGIEVEYLYSSFNQKYTVNTASRGLVQTKNHIISHDIPILIRFKPSFTQNRYFEAGINLSSLQEAVYTDTLSNSFEVHQKFLKNNIAFVFGGGADFTLYKSLKWTVGFRAQIGLSDIAGTDAVGRDVGDNTIFTNSHPTTTFDLGIVTGIHYLFYKK